MNRPLDLARLPSAGHLAGEILLRMGVRPPLTTMKLTPSMHDRWTGSFHGGWQHAEPALFGQSIPAAASDISSCHPLVAHLIGWWDLVCAEQITVGGATRDVKVACRQALDDVTTVLDPSLWRSLGCTLVEVVPDGETWPIEVVDPKRSDGRLEFVPVHTDGHSLFYAWPDVVNASILSERVPRIVRAFRLVPQGRHENITSHLTVLPELVIHGAEDPALALVARRRQAKAAEDPRTAALLRVVVNALVYGNFCRFDDIRVRGRRGWETSEKPGPWNCMPIASTVTAGSHLLLGIYDRLVADLGSRVLYRDTDSSIVPALPDGGSMTLSSGQELTLLSWEQVDHIARHFGSLAPTPDWPLWKVDRGTASDVLRVITFGPKRRIEFTKNGPRVTVTKRTETALGGFFADPPSMTGRAPITGRLWTFRAAEQVVTFQEALHRDPQALRPTAAWEAEGASPFPAIRRLSVRSPEILKTLPADLRARPGSRYLEGTVDRRLRGMAHSPIALDPGNDLFDWSELDWRARATGQGVKVTTDTSDIHAVLLDTLDHRVIDWEGRPTTEPIEEVHVIPGLIQRVGRVSGVIDGELDGVVDPGSRRTVFDEGDPRAVIHALAKALGAGEFERRTGLPSTVAKRAASGRNISAKNVARALDALRRPERAHICALEECQASITRSNAYYCSPAHADRAYRMRRRRSAPSSQLPICPVCGTVQPALPVEGPCPFCPSSS